MGGGTVACVSHGFADIALLSFDAVCGVAIAVFGVNDELVLIEVVDGFVSA